MANRYWVGGAGTWDGTSTTNWSDTTGGSSGFSAPTSADDVFFDANSGTGIITISASGTANNVSFNSTTLTLTLGANVTISGSFTFVNGTLNLASYILICNSFLSNNTNSRNITGSGSFNIQGSGAVWDVNATNLTTSARGYVNFTYVSPSTLTVRNVSATSYLTSPRMKFPSGNYPLTITSGSSLSNIDFTGFTGTWDATSGTYTIYDDLTLVSGMTFISTGSTFTLGVTGPSGGLLTSAGKTFNNITINAPYTTQNLALADNITLTGALTVTQGGFTLNNHNITMNNFSSSGTLTRNFGLDSGSVINITGTGTVWDTSIATNLTIFGASTGRVNITHSGSTAITINSATSGGSSANYASFNFTGGTYALTIAAGSRLGSLNFTGFAGTWSPGTSSYSFYGTATITLVSGMTFTTPTSGTWSFFSNSTSPLYPVTIISAGKTLRSIAASTNVIISDPMVLSSTFTLNAGTLTLNANLTCTAFSSTGTTTRAIAFGTNSITTTGSGTAWNTGTATGFTYTGTPTVNIANATATATTISAHTTSGTEANALNFNVTTGTYALTVSSTSVIGSLTFTGFTGTWAPGGASYTFYRDLTLVSGMTFTTGSNGWTFASTSGTQTITSAGKSLYTIIVNAVGGTVRLADNITLTQALQLTAGTFNTNGYNITVSILSSASSNTRVWYFNSSTITIRSALSVGSATNLTFNAGTSTFVLESLTASANVTFSPASGTTLNNLVFGSPSVTGQTFTLQGSNTFNTISSTKTVAFTISLQSGSTTTCSNWTVSGTLGNVVTLKSGTTGSLATLTKSGGGTVTVDYFDIKDSNATPSSTWYATNSINSGNNIGWYFDNNNSNYFLMF